MKGVKVPAPASFIRDLVISRIDEVINATGADDIIIYLTGKGNFRFEIATVLPYKGNRSGCTKPYHWSTVDFVLRDHFGVTEIKGAEADDELGITQKTHNDTKISTAICSRDKDLRMCEGWHYSWGCGSTQPEKPLYHISRLEGIKFFFKQMFTGDSTDHILGCAVREELEYKSGKKKGQLYTRRKGIGPKAADTLLSQGETPQSWYELVRDEYKKLYPDNYEDIMLENARLLFIGQTYDKRFEWDWIEVKTYGRTETPEEALEKDGDSEASRTLKP